MNRHIALFISFAFLLPLPAAAEIIPLSALSQYLNGLTTVESDFTQINSDGSISTGKIYIDRPGRVRFEYAPPDRSLVIAEAQTVAIFDAKSNQAPAPASDASSGAVWFIGNRCPVRPGRREFRPIQRSGADRHPWAAATGRSIRR